MPIQIEELTIIDRSIGPDADPAELGRKIAELEARLEAIEKVIVVDEESVTLRADRVFVRGTEEVTIQTPASSLKIDTTGFVIQAAGAMRCSTGLYTLECGSANFNTSSAVFSGFLKAETVTTNTIIAAVYTPGVGNIF